MNDVPVDNIRINCITVLKSEESSQPIKTMYLRIRNVFPDLSAGDVHLGLGHSKMLAEKVVDDTIKAVR